MGLFEVTNTIGVATVAQVKELFSSYNLLDKLIAYVEDEGDNLCTLAWILTFFIKFVPFGFTIPWQGSCLCHVFSETWQYACNDTNVCKGFHEVSLKAI